MSYGLSKIPAFRTKSIIKLGHVPYPIPNGAMYLYGTHLCLKVVPMSLLLGLCMYYIGTWTHWVLQPWYVDHKPFQGSFSS